MEISVEAWLKTMSCNLIWTQIREGCKNLFTEFLLNSVCDVFLGFDQFFQGHSVYPTIVKNKIAGPLLREIYTFANV